MIGGFGACRTKRLSAGKAVWAYWQERSKVTVHFREELGMLSKNYRRLKKKRQKKSDNNVYCDNVT